MKIGFDAKRAFFNRSGLGNYSRTLISGLYRLFPENTYYLFSPGLNTKNILFSPEKAEIIFPSSMAGRLLPSFWRSFWMGRDIKKTGINIFHGLSNELPADIKKSRAKSIVTLHDLIFLRYPSLYPTADRAIYRAKFSFSCKSADAVIAVSNQTKNDIVEYFHLDPSRIFVIYQGCNPDFYKSQSDENLVNIRKKFSLPEEFILYVGTIEERKNLLSLVRAIHEYQIDLPLIVIGKETPYLSKVKDYIHKEHVSRISFLRNVSSTDLPAIYQLARIFVYPSSCEGFGIPVLEALNSGVPVITGTDGPLMEAGGAAALYINPLEIEELAWAIRRVLDDAGLRDRMRIEGKRHVMQFREEITIAKVMDLYRDLA